MLSVSATPVMLQLTSCFFPSFSHLTPVIINFSFGSYDLACFSPEVGSSKEICWIKSSEKITAKESTVDDQLVKAVVRHGTLDHWTVMLFPCLHMKPQAQYVLPVDAKSFCCTRLMELVGFHVQKTANMCIMLSQTRAVEMATRSMF